MHLSAHDRSYGMHIKVAAPGRPVRHVYPYPEPFQAGLTRVVQVRLALPSATHAAPARADRVVWIEAPPDPQLWVAVEVVLAEPGTDSGDWRLGTTAIRSISRSGGGSIEVVAHGMQGLAGSVTAHATDDERRSVRDAIASGADIRAIVHGLNPDGSLWLLELVRDAFTSAP